MFSMNSLVSQEIEESNPVMRAYKAGDDPEMPGSIEKGLAQRFLWMFPKPVYGRFHSLKSIDKTFSDT